MLASATSVAASLGVVHHLSRLPAGPVAKMVKQRWASFLLLGSTTTAGLYYFRLGLRTAADPASTSVAETEPSGIAGPLGAVTELVSDSRIREQDDPAARRLRAILNKKASASNAKETGDEKG